MKLFQTGWDNSQPLGPALKATLEEPYTIFAAFIGSRQEFARLCDVAFA